MSITTLFSLIALSVLDVSPAAPEGPAVVTQGIGLGRVSNVVPLDGGCVTQVSTPTTSVEKWDVQQGRTYAITLTHVTDCANGGTDPFIEVMVKSSNTGNLCYTATKISTGVYTFTVDTPVNACHTYPIVYCTTGCEGNSGMFARRSDGGDKHSHLRAANYPAGCGGGAVSDVDCTQECSAWVTNLYGGCGAPTPSLQSTLPLAGNDALISVTGAPVGAPVILAAQGAPYPASAPLGGGCILHIDPAIADVFGPFVTSTIGDFWVPVYLPPSTPVFTARIQAAVFAPGGPLLNVMLTNAIQPRFGFCAPFCTYSALAFTGGGLAGQAFNDHYLEVFPSGLDVGVFDSGNGASSPNGLRFSGDLAGRAALAAFLQLPAAPSGPFAGDATNPAGTLGGGSLAVQAAALALNIQLNGGGFLGGAHTNLGYIMYLKMDVFDALSGLTVSQILATANQALAGGALPVGYTYDSLANFIQFLNESFGDCSMSPDASHRLYNPEFE